MKNLHIDIETYSSADITVVGSYKYTQSLDFEILLCAYAFDEDSIQIIDMASGRELPPEFLEALMDPRVKKHAHNATFERVCFKALGFDIPADQWECSLVKAAYCGWPMSLDELSKAMDLGEKGKLSTGKALIKFFCSPCEPKKSNDFRNRNFPLHDPQKWELFKEYCINDVEAERQVSLILAEYHLPPSEKILYALDQEINSNGVLIDQEIARNAFDFDTQFSGQISAEMVKLTGVDNPNSSAQLKQWLSKAMKKEITSLAKDSVQELLDETDDGAVSDVLGLRMKLAKTSTKKYVAMINCAGEDSRARGLFQFYGASKTGRWAGRLIQMQNLPRNQMNDLAEARAIVKANDYDLFTMMYDDISTVLSELIRTAFIPGEGNLFVVSDFSAIEARVVSWIANERWRLDVFKTHGKIYEASASMMFKVPIESVTKGSSLRHKGKIAELALGYQGSLGAIKKMGGEKMGLSDTEMKAIVTRWRRANPSIVDLWKGVEDCAKWAIKNRKKVHSIYRNIIFEYDGKYLMIQLPSGRKLFYVDPTLCKNRFGAESIKFKGIDQDIKQWTWIETFGGKLVENIVQAVSRDLLAHSMIRLKEEGFKIVMHVHDEIVAEVSTRLAEEGLKTMSRIMGEEVSWAGGLPLRADGYITPFYKKD